MKMPKFKVGDVVMLQTGSYYMTITEIDSSGLAHCVRNGSNGLIENDLPLRTLVRLNERVPSVEAGDFVLCRATEEYYHVRQFDADTRMATCYGKRGVRDLPINQLIRLHIDYDG